MDTTAPAKPKAKTSSSKAARAKAPKRPPERPSWRILKRHLPLVIDLCHSFVLDSGDIRPVLRAIAREVETHWSRLRFRKYEQAWILKIVLEQLERYHEVHFDRAKLYELEHMGQQEESPESRLSNIGVYLKRLSAEDLFLVCAHLKLGISLESLSNVLGKPVASIEIQLSQALASVASWIWKSPTQDSEPVMRAVSALPGVDAHVLKGLTPELLRQPGASEPATLRVRWRRSPWWFRNLVETLAVALLVVSVLALVPRIRQTYETNLQKRLQAFDLQEIAAQSSSGVPFQVPIPSDDGSVLSASDSAEDSGPSVPAPADEDSLTQSTETGVTLPSSPVLTVGTGEIWRFSMRTESIKETRPKIQKLLETAGLAKGSADGRGLEAPGGVLYNVLLDQDKVANLMTSLETMTQTGPSTGAIPRESGFTWFKNSSMRPIPKGKTRVVIWISQL